MRGARVYIPQEPIDVMLYLEQHYNLKPIPMFDVSNFPDMSTLLGLNSNVKKVRRSSKNPMSQQKFLTKTNQSPRPPLSINVTKFVLKKGVQERQ